MGVVYEAEQVSLGRHVALKVLPAARRPATPDGLERFRREARAAARLHHTNIVPVFGVGEDGGVHYYAMQFIQGQPLDVVLDELKALRRPARRPATAPTPPDGRRPTAAEVARSLLTGRFDAGTAAEPDRAPEAPATAAVPRRGTVGRLVGGPARPVGALRGRVGPAPLLPQRRPGRASRRPRRWPTPTREGVLHRDIKPSNLLLDAAGHASGSPTSAWPRPTATTT